MEPTDKCRLALLGQAVGDAFGAPFEYHPEAPRLAALSMREGRYLDGYIDCQNKIERCRLPGLYTDDTQQALVLLRVRDSKSPYRAVLSTFQSMASTPGGSFGVHRGTGANFRQAVSLGTPPPTAGLGAAMRVGPVATLFDDVQEMIDWVYTVSRVTTVDPLGLACAVRFAAVAWGLSHRDQADKLRSIRWPKDVPKPVWKVFTQARERLETDGEEALVQFGRETGLADKAMTNAANGFGLTGTVWAIHHATQADCFQNALLGVCQSGGDTDTVAAMTGCLAALRFGINDIPYWMIEDLQGRAGIENPETWDPVESERELTRLEVRYRKNLELPKPSGPVDFVDEALATPEPLEPVLFYGAANPNGEFSNFYASPFELDGERWPDVEHYFMAQKNPQDREYQRAIRAASTPGRAKALGREVRLRPNWDNIKYGIMLRAVRAKFGQNPALREMLLATGDRPLHENCKDPWWGGGPNFKGGRDWLGRILMQVRKELRG